MADDWFPKTGEVMFETTLRDWLAGLMEATGGFVVSGLTVPASSVNLNLSVASGVAYVGGYRLEADAEVIALSGTNTHYIYLQYSIDGSNNITGHALTSNTTGVTPARSVLICTAVTNGSAITSTTDRRKVGFNVNQGYQLQSITTATIDATSGTVQSVINVTESGMLFKLLFSDNASTANMTVSIQVDGDTPFTEQIMASGSFTGNLINRFSELGTAGAGQQRLDLNLPYRQSLVITVEVTSTGTGNLQVFVLRGKAVA